MGFIFLNLLIFDLIAGKCHIPADIQVKLKTNKMQQDIHSGSSKHIAQGEEEHNLSSSNNSHG